MASKKRLTQKDIKLRARIKAELQAAGRLPPDKPKLNRAKFCEEADQILKDNKWHEINFYILWAIKEMLGHKDHWASKRSRSLQAVGVAKVIKLAKARMDLQKSKKDCTYEDLYEATKDIFNA